MDTPTKVTVGDVTITIERAEQVEPQPPTGAFSKGTYSTYTRDALLGRIQQLEVLVTKQGNVSEQYAELREAIRRMSAGVDGHAPLVQTHEEALAAVGNVFVLGSKRGRR
jgi:hypothetical protein